MLRILLLYVLHFFLLFFFFFLAASVGYYYCMISCKRQKRKKSIRIVILLASKEEVDFRHNRCIIFVYLHICVKRYSLLLLLEKKGSKRESKRIPFVSGENNR